MRNRAAPVTITKPDGSRHVVSAYDLRQRPDAAAGLPEDTPPSPDDIDQKDLCNQELLEEMTRTTLYKVMRDSDKLSERTAAATAAVKYLAIKYRIGPEYGQDLDEEKE